MAHLSHSTLRMLRDMTTGLLNFSIEESGVCRGFALGKYTKTVFSISDNKSKGVLDFIHSDLCGPMSFASLKKVLSATSRSLKIIPGRTRSNF